MHPFRKKQQRSRIKGARLTLSLDPGDAVEPDFVIVGLTITDVIFAETDSQTIVARLDRPAFRSTNHPVIDLLLAGVGMNVVDELFGVSSRPPGLPVLVGIWRLNDRAALEQIVATRRPPPASEFMGRGELSLA